MPASINNIYKNRIERVGGQPVYTTQVLHGQSINAAVTTPEEANTWYMGVVASPAIGEVSLLYRFYFRASG